MTETLTLCNTYWIDFYTINLNHDMKCHQYIQRQSCHNGSYNNLTQKNNQMNR